MTHLAPPRDMAGEPGGLMLPAPTHSDATAGRASRMIGGVWGRHAGVAPRSWWTPLRVVMAMTAFTLLLGFAQKSPCADGVWSGNKQYTHMCYSDVVPLWGDERLNIGAVPYRDTAVEYPVLTGGAMWLGADLTRGVHAIDSSWSEVVIFGVLTALALSACGLLVTAGTAQSARRRPYDAAIFALSPLLIVHAFSNWDLLAMAFMSGAMWAWARKQPVLAGTLIALGTAAKLYPVFLLVAIAILAIRTRRYAPAVWATITAVLVWLTVNVPIALAYYDGWAQFYRFSIERPTERSTVWAMGRTLYTVGVGSSDAPNWKPPIIAVGFVVVAAFGLVAWVGLRAPVKPRLAQLTFLVVLVFLLTTKVWSPQYSLWLVPLIALARPRWRITLLWQLTEIAVWFLTLTLLLGELPGQQAHGIGYDWLMIALVARDVMLLGIAALVVREMWHPELDVVRVGGLDDPGGGYFDGAPDFYAMRQTELREAELVQAELVQAELREADLGEAELRESEAGQADTSDARRNAISPP